MALLSADPDLSGQYTGTILADDPGACTQAQSPLIALSLAEEDFTTETLGGRMQGAHKVITTFGVHVYVADPAAENDPAALLVLKTQLITLSETVREALWKYRIDPPDDPMSQLWFNAAFRQPATRYTSARNFRKSTTMIDFQSWVRNR